MINLRIHGNSKSYDTPFEKAEREGWVNIWDLIRAWQCNEFHYPTGTEVGMSVEVDETGLGEAGIKYLGLELVDTDSQEIGHLFEAS